MLLQAFIQFAQALELILFDAAGGNSRPQLDDPRQIVHGQFRHALFVHPGQLLRDAHVRAPELCEAGVVVAGHRPA